MAPAAPPKKLSILAAALCFACSGAEEHPAPIAAAGGVGEAGVAPTPTPTPNPPAATRCSPPMGLNGSPGTIEEAVALLNALPKPTSVACFVEALERPLGITATSSVFSAQPALSFASPRVFIKRGLLWLSIVIDGESSYLMEFGYRPSESDMTSVKGELAFPLEHPVALSAPYERVRSGSGTICGLCHASEQPASGLPFAEAFISNALRPRPETHVSLGALRAQRAACDARVSPHRCEMLAALLDGGEVVEEPFPDAMPTFF